MSQSLLDHPRIYHDKLSCCFGLFFTNYYFLSNDAGCVLEEVTDCVTLNELSLFKTFHWRKFWVIVTLKYCLTINPYIIEFEDTIIYMYQTKHFLSTMYQSWRQIMFYEPIIKYLIMPSNCVLYKAVRVFSFCYWKEQDSWNFSEHWIIGGGMLGIVFF